MQTIKVPFPPEALSRVVSLILAHREATYVIERLNEVLGPCGVGWRYAHSPFEELHTDNGRAEIVTEVTFQYWFPANDDCAGRDKWHGMPRLTGGSSATVARTTTEAG